LVDVCCSEVNLPSTLYGRDTEGREGGKERIRTQGYKVSSIARRQLLLTTASPARHWTLSWDLRLSVCVTRTVTTLCAGHSDVLDGTSLAHGTGEQVVPPQQLLYVRSVVADAGELPAGWSLDVFAHACRDERARTRRDRCKKSLMMIEGMSLSHSETGIFSGVKCTETSMIHRVGECLSEETTDRKHNVRPMDDVDARPHASSRAVVHTVRRKTC
jgi:hypothetical protein